MAYFLDASVEQNFFRISSLRTLKFNSRNVQSTFLRLEALNLYLRDVTA